MEDSNRGGMTSQNEKDGLRDLSVRVGRSGGGV